MKWVPKTAPKTIEMDQNIMVQNAEDSQLQKQVQPHKSDGEDQGFKVIQKGAKTTQKYTNKTSVRNSFKGLELEVEPDDGESMEDMVNEIDFHTEEGGVPSVQYG